MKSNAPVAGGCEAPPFFCLARNLLAPGRRRAERATHRAWRFPFRPPACARTVMEGQRSNTGLLQKVVQRITSPPRPCGECRERRCKRNRARVVRSCPPLLSASERFVRGPRRHLCARPRAELADAYLGGDRRAGCIRSKPTHPRAQWRSSRRIRRPRALALARRLFSPAGQLGSRPARPPL